jgi:hypothetical protein
VRVSEYASAAFGGILDGEEIYLRLAASASAAEEAVSDSARVGAASSAAGRALLILALAASGGFAAGRRLADVLLPPPPAPSSTRPRPAPRRPPLPAMDAAFSAPRVPADEEGAQKALLLAGDWRGREDGRTIDERLGVPVDLPGAAPTWSADRTGENTYLVTRRGPDGEEYVFEVDLDQNRAAPDRETRLRLSPQLTAVPRSDDAVRVP